MRLVFVILLLLPTLARAEPVTAILGTVIIGSITVGQVLLFVGSLVYGMAQQKKMEKRARADAARQRDAYNAGLQDRTINQIATEVGHTYIYGRARVGALIVGMFNSGGRDEYKHLVIVHAAHECDAIEDVFVNGESLGPLDADGNVTTGRYISVATGSHSQTTVTGTSIALIYPAVVSSIRVFRFTPRNDDTSLQEAIPHTLVGNTVFFSNPPPEPGQPQPTIEVIYQYRLETSMIRVRKHLGTADDPADASLLAELPGKWLPTAVLRGFCYTVIRLNLNQAEFQNGLPQIEMLIRGKKLYNFRTGITAWSQNPAEVVRDYLLSEICGVDEVDLPLDQFIAAANVCDEAQSFGPHYTFNGTVTSDMPQAGVLERMAQAMAGGIVATTWDIYAGKYMAPVMALEQSDIVGAFALTPGISDADLFNGVRGQYTSAETGYVATDFVPYQSPVYVGADGRELWTNIDFGFTDGVQRVHNLCRIFTEDQRNSYMFKAEFSLKAWRLKVGQRITMTSALFGWTDKVFRITDKKYSPSSAVELSLKVDDPSIWDFADAVSPAATPNTGLPNPFQIDRIALVTCQSGSEHLLAQDGTVISRILATWPVSSTPAVYANGLIEIEWQLLSSDVWSKATASGSETQVYLSPVEDNQFYQVRVRAVNPYLNLKSDWTYAVLHQVIGKTAPPRDVVMFSIANGALTWSQVMDLDMAGYLLRFQYAQNPSWADAAPLHNGLITASPWRPPILPPGPITIMIKAVDTSGNESVNAAVIYHNFGDTIVDNLILVVDDKANGFPGQKIDGSVIGGDLLADDSGDLFWGAELARFWGNAAGAFWPTQTFKEMTYITGHVVAQDEAGSRLTLALQVAAASYTVEYRYDTQGLFWRDGDAYFWEADDQRFWPPPLDWAIWPGAIEDVAEGLIEFRVVTQAGTVRGAITEFVIQMDVEDEYEEIDDVHISAAGTRLPIVKRYRSIKNIQLTLQDDADNAVTAKWADKLATGPLIYCFDNAGNPVTGTIDARIQGVKG